MIESVDQGVLTEPYIVEPEKIVQKVIEYRERPVERKET